MLEHSSRSITTSAVVRISFSAKAHALGYLRNLKERVVQEHFVRFACVKHIAEVA